MGSRPNKKNECDKCGREFASQRWLTRHIKSVHSEPEPEPEPKKTKKALAMVPELEKRTLLNGRDRVELGDRVIITTVFIVRSLTETEYSKDLIVEVEKVNSNWSKNY